MEQSIPLWYMAIPFMVLFVAWLSVSIFNVIHTLKFGYVNYISYFMTFAFLAISIIIIFITFDLLSSVEWQYQIPLNLNF